MQSALAVISLKNIVGNALLVQKRAGVPLIAVVKDDAYGHGAEKVSLALEPYVSAFAVSTVLEGTALRIAGVGKEILVLTPCLCEEEALSCFFYNLTPTISCLAALRLLQKTSEKYGLLLRAQMKLNTGMNRYGFRIERVGAAVKEAKRDGMEISGVFSHFYAPEDEIAREEQYALFQRGAEEVKSFFPNAVRHLSATGGILAGKKYNFDFVRSGIALYGYLPAGFEGKINVKPAMKIYATVSQSGMFTGGGIGYQKSEKHYRKLSTVRLGYGDGFPRAGGMDAIGNLCMDAHVRTGGAPFGKRRLTLQNVTELAGKQNTITYEILVNIGKKAEKIYV